MKKIGIYNPDTNQTEWFDDGSVELAIARARQVSPIKSGFTHRRKWKSQSMGVHRLQVPEANAFLKANGITNAHHDPRTGELVMDRNWTQADRNRLLRAKGLMDGDAGYGDYAGK